MVLYVLLSLLIIVIYVSSYNPLIGFLSTPLSNCPKIDSNNFTSCITNFYVEFIKNVGGIPVSIDYNSNNIEFYTVLNKVDAVFLLGGDFDITNKSSKYFKAVQLIYSYSLEEKMPLIGICNGMEIISILAADDVEILSLNKFDAEFISLPLNISNDNTFINNFPNDIINILKTENVSFNYHHDGIKPIDFYNNKKISDNYQIVATNIDRNGVSFISIFEAKEYPIYGLQFHPERIYDFCLDNINHNEKSIKANTEFGFIRKAKLYRFEKNQNILITDKVDNYNQSNINDILIYRHKMIYFNETCGYIYYI